MTKISWLGEWLPVLHRLPETDRERRALALTIDDGPSDSTPGMLDALKAADAKATFFLSGNRVLDRPDLVERIVADGHSVYAHGMEHVRLDEEPASRLGTDMTAAESLLSRFRPTPEPYLVRLPYAAGRRKTSTHRAIRAWSATAQIAHWNLSTEDYLLAPLCRDLAEVTRRCEDRARALACSPRLNGAIILVHDCPFDVESPFVAELSRILVEKIVAVLSEMGCLFVPLRPQTRRDPVRSFLLER